MIHYLDINGQVKSVEAKSSPTLKEMQEYVGGYIEVTTCLFKGQTRQMIVNEEGLLIGLPLNLNATAAVMASFIVNKGAFPQVVITGNAIILEDLQLD